MAQVYLGLGSNIEPAANLRLAVSELRERFGDVRLSTVYRSPPLGFDGDDFLNLAAGLNSGLSPREVVREFDDIHRIAGRERDGDKLLPRTIDIDLLLYNRLIVDSAGLQLPRKDVLEYAFVLRPLSELAPDYIHPISGRRLREHWEDFDRTFSEMLTKESISL